MQTKKETRYLSQSEWTAQQPKLRMKNTLSRPVTTELTNNITKQEKHTSSETRNISKIKIGIKGEKNKTHSIVLSLQREQMDGKDSWTRFVKIVD